MFRGIKLRQREVIDISTAERIGFVTDVEINEATGRIDSIIVPRRGWFFIPFFKSSELVIPWQDIEIIGKDIILVRYRKSETEILIDDKLT